MTREEFTEDLLYIYSQLVAKTPIDSLSDDAKVQVIGHLLESSNNALRIMKEMSLFDAQIGELNASAAYKMRQESALDDAVRRDTAKIACEALGIIKSAGNNAGAWWDVASKSINALAGTNIAAVTTDP